MGRRIGVHTRQPDYQQRNNMHPYREAKQYGASQEQFCPSGGQVCREPPGTLTVSVVHGRNVVTDEQPIS